MSSVPRERRHEAERGKPRWIEMPRKGEGAGHLMMSDAGLMSGRRWSAEACVAG